ncbi:MAG: amino acid adenylation domain-containing protein [Clostridiales bacterium]|nr:amino acid adenylation domain-containing protein [Clostridiales bacterium]
MKEKRHFYDLSYPQRGVWNLEKLYPNISIGNLSSTLKINAPLNFAIMEKALNHTIQKNSAFRTRITEIKGQPKQYMVPYKYQPIDVFDFSNGDIKKMYEWDEVMTRKPIYETDSQLFYAAFLKTNKHSVALYIKFHHIIADAWTIITFGNDFMAFYKTITDGGTVDEIENPSYFDYIEKERQYLASNRFIKDETFWLEQYKNIPELKTLKPRKMENENKEAKRKTYILPDKLAKKIRQHCSNSNTSIFSLYLSAMALYFNRTRGDDEVVFGTPVLNRSNVKDKNTYGMFISTAPIKVTIDDSQDYNTFAETINTQWMSLLKHQKYPYTILLQKLREKHNDFKKLYDVVISYQNAKFIKSESEYQHEGRWHQCGYQMESLNIHINDRESDGDIIIDYDYLTDLFYEKEIDFLNAHVISLLWHSIDNPARKLPYIEMISENEKEKILYNFNDTKTSYPRDKTVQSLFEDQVLKAPLAPCIIFEGKQLTYSQFNEKANMLARYLRENGIGPNDIISVLIPRSHELMITIMGIIKAGASYLPMNPEYPVDRINRILVSSNSKMLLTHSSVTKDQLSCNQICKVDQIDLKNYETSNLPNNNSPNDLIYTIYTSGTEGNPKGVMIEHKSLINFIYGVKDLLDFTNKSRVLSVTSTTFDIFVFENFTSWLTGSCIILANEMQQNNPLELKKLIVENTIDKILTTPSRMKMLMNEKSYGAFLQNITVIMLGGEVFPGSLYLKLRRETNAKIVDGYGPTETTIGVTFKELKRTINIGKPIANTQIYILDKHKNLLPIGVPGEMYIGGECLSRGYLNDDKLTQEKFVENPFMKKEKLYKTGDYARWYSQGEIEYICRLDSQIKINGYRVELQEIEKSIARFNGIKDVVVIDFDDNHQNKYLCAYLIYDEKISLPSLRNALKETLPRYMIPSYFVEIDHIPLTLSGKIDKKRLPKPNTHKDFKKKTIAPRNKSEKLLHTIWCDLLKSASIGIDDDFFEMGGDSLAAIQMVSFLYTHTMTVSIQNIYDYPTIRTLSHLISTNKKKIHFTPKNKKYKVSNAHICFEKTPLAELIETNKLAKIDSAAITYIPEDIVETLAIHKEPTLFNYMETAQGNIGLFAIPISSRDLYSNKKTLISLCQQTINIAHHLGAKVVSLTGLIPSATSYGYDLEKVLRNEPLSAKITTGHSTTAASVVLSIERLLKHSNRTIVDERVAFVGLGSVGTSVAKLLLSVLEHPASLTLCDIYQRSDFLYDFRKHIETRLSYENDIMIAISNGSSLPDEVYEATMIVGATNVPNILDISKIKPGTLIIDDSGPHCFNKEDAIKRLHEKSDILFTEGGVLESNEIINKRIYLPAGIRDNVLNSYSQQFASDRDITGCILSSLLSAKYDSLQPVLGISKLSECIRNYKLLNELQYLGAMPHCDDYIIPTNFIKNFTRNFGKKMR